MLKYFELKCKQILFLINQENLIDKKEIQSRYREVKRRGGEWREINKIKKNRFKILTIIV